MVAASSFAGPALSSFERLFLEEYARVVAIAYRITADRDEAEDVAQEVFVQCARRRMTERAGTPAWLYRAAAHAALNAIRSRRRRSERELRAFRLTQSVGPAPANAQDPQRILEAESDRAAVRRVLRRIPARDAQILALRYAGLSYNEIAQSLSVAAQQIGTRLARAERAFRKEIQREAS
ncbi:MAG TPA: sigma-70 family RNA polymerase sigma factor [Candidatus Baltobacteraceae bacterium]|nr:sigma-70 family RNA polymerase sigma factor [Candidatus Baltobacteraceae bacterium]